MVFKPRLISSVLLFGLVLRLVAVNQSLWLDEAIGAIAVRDYSYSEILSKFILADNHTPGYYLSLKLWTSIFGFSELAIRSLNIGFGLLTIVVVYKIALFYFKDKKIALFSTSFLAISQYFVYYSQEARMYSPVALFASLSIYSFLKTFETSANKYWLAFSLSILGLIVFDYMPIFFLLVFPIYAYIKKPKKHWWERVVISTIPLGLFSLMWVPIFLVQTLNYSNVSTKFLFGGASVKQIALLWMKFVLGRISFEPKLVYYFLVAVFSAPFLVALLKSIKNRKSIIFWLWFLVPIIFSFSASFFFPAFSYFRLTYVFPAFSILIAIGLSKLGRKRLLIFSLIVVSQLLSLFIYFSDSNQQREEWREAVNFLVQNSEENSVILFDFSAPVAGFEWYNNGRLNAYGATDSISSNSLPTKIRTQKLVEDKHIVYYFDYLRDLSDPERTVENTLMNLGFEEIKVFGQFYGIGQIHKWQKR